MSQSELSKIIVSLGKFSQSSSTAVGASLTEETCKLLNCICISYMLGNIGFVLGNRYKDSHEILDVSSFYLFTLAVFFHSKLFQNMQTGVILLNQNIIIVKRRYLLLIF